MNLNDPPTSKSISGWACWFVGSVLDFYFEAEVELIRLHFGPQVDDLNLNYISVKLKCFMYYILVLWSYLIEADEQDKSVTLQVRLCEYPFLALTLNWAVREIPCRLSKIKNKN